ncbi:MAG: manganese efflux pump MntP [Treponemataceae bacterium]
MPFYFEFFLNSFFLGTGLAMDAFSVSLANGLNESEMKNTKMYKIAGVYAFFQFLMPMIGWLCVHTIVAYFKIIEKFIPWIALILLLYIGGKMFTAGIKNNKHHSAKECEQEKKLTFGILMLQGISTSIDALSVGFTIAGYGILKSLSASLIIAIVTFFICIAGLAIGKKAGTKLSSNACLVGGIILIGIGIKIFIKGILF